MRLGPEDPKNWQGFLDLVQPPPGYRLAAALGTTFGLSLEALTAALLTMRDADGEELAGNPVAATIAITRLRDRVRVLVHPATTTGPSAGRGAYAFLALLDRLAIEMPMKTALFHPKVWALRFEHVGHPRPGRPAEIGRVVVGSRNLTASTSFELAAVFEGAVATAQESPSSFGRDVQRALREWMTATGARFPESVWRLPDFIGTLAFDVPREAETALRLRWQGGGARPLVQALPSRLERVLIVSPFLQPGFLDDMLGRTTSLQVVSLPESLDGLPDETLAALEARAEQQGTPALYQVESHEAGDDAFIEGVHAKLLLASGPGSQDVTFIGSANATGPGWGLGATANVEAMVEMRPGVDFDGFVKDFIRPNKSTVHPWLSEYARTADRVIDPERELERQALAALREAARIGLVIRYDANQRELELVSQRDLALPPWVFEGGLTFSVSPMLLSEGGSGWRPIDNVLLGNCRFPDIPLSKVTAFVVLKARSGTFERQRLVMGRLDVSDAVLDQRDEAVSTEILRTADPAMVLSALVRGLAHVSSGRGESRGLRSGASLGELLGETTLERLLQAVAVEPGLIKDIRLLLGPLYGDALLKLCSDLEDAVGPAHGEVAP